MAQFSLNIPEELNEMVQRACAISGRSRNSACIDWILEGVLKELKLYEQAGYIRNLKSNKNDEEE